MRENHDCAYTDISTVLKMCHPHCPQAGEEDFVADAPKNGKNQFNFSERAAQTFNNTLCTRGVATEPPPVVSIYYWFDFLYSLSIIVKN
jgi:hypothetical protein